LGCVQFFAEAFSLLVVVGRLLNVTTVKDYSYDQTWLSTAFSDHIVLKIKACRDAHILLSDTLGMGSNMYEAALGIGGNTKSVMREGPYYENVVWADTPGIMDCNGFK
jgi:hypothetical protein